MTPEQHDDHAADRAVASDDARGPDLPNIPLLDAESPRAGDVRPTWRGWIHAGTFPVAVAAGIVLVVLADGATATWASAVFALSSLLLFGMSALYHRFDWSPRAKVLLKRFDHSNIFLLIAGSYTPIALLALPPSKGVILLAAVWAGALVGIGFRVFWIGAPRWLYVALYIALGWAAMAYIVDIFAASPVTMTLVVVGGLLYTGGAVMYALKRPNPWPGHFGFHELFHVCTVLAFLCHWTAIMLLAIDPVFNG
jgi:hemolysin III